MTRRDLGQPRRPRRRGLGWLLLVALVAVVVAFVLSGAVSRDQPPGTSPPTTAAKGLPRMDVTPGVILTTSRTDVCTPGWAGKHRHSLTVKQKTVVLRAYGYPKDTKVAEWDHLVSLELGGGNGPQNIWPQVSAPDQQRKDRFENTLHRQVCAGRLDLAVAQAHIKEFWRWW